MKLLINNKYENVGFWSFLKCNFLTGVVTTTLIYIALAIIFYIIGVTIA